jgi:hypothetical protein
MSRLARQAPVLWINSIGMRAPTPGKTELLLHRYVRKFKSTLKGLRRDDETGMWVYSPLFIPRYTSTMAEVNGVLLRWQVAALCRKIGIRNPAVWATVPTAAPAVQRGRWAATVFNRSDDFAAFPEANAAFIAPLEKRLLTGSDTVVYVNRALFDRERGSLKDPRFLGHGVDFEHFAKARPEGQRPEAPAPIRGLPRPIVGFYGALDSYTIDLDLMIKVARHIAPATLLVIGPKAMDVSRLVAEPNVVYLGPVPYAELPKYAAQFDVAIMPWLQNEWIAACNPIKLKEYLALGFPVVSMRFPELHRLEGLVYAAGTHGEFIAGLDRALREKDGDLVRRRRDAIRQDSWDSLASQVKQLLRLEISSEARGEEDALVAEMS